MRVRARHPASLQVGGSYVAYKILDAKHQIGNDVKWMRRLLPLKREMGKFYTEGGSSARLWLVPRVAL